MIKQIKPQKIIVYPNSRLEKTGVVFGENEEENLLYWKDDKSYVFKLDKSNFKNYKILKSKTYTVYVITNDINDKIYIGKTSKKLEYRFYQHLKTADLGIDKRQLYEDMRTFGKEHFKIEPLVEINAVYDCSEIIEIYTISKLNTKQPNGYNISNQHCNDFYFIWYYIYDFCIKTENEKFKSILTNYFVNEMKFYDNWNKYSLDKINEQEIEYYVSNSVKNQQNILNYFCDYIKNNNLNENSFENLFKYVKSGKFLQDKIKKEIIIKKIKGE